MHVKNIDTLIAEQKRVPMKFNQIISKKFLLRCNLKNKTFSTRKLWAPQTNFQISCEIARRFRGFF